MQPYRNSYKNAYEVLPEELVRKLQQIYTGSVWIPATEKRLIKNKGMIHRDRKIIGLYEQGKTIREISEVVFLSEERVRQIIKKSGGNRNGR